METQLRCNICDTMVNTIQAKEHAVASLHVLLKSKLQHELDVMREGTYKNDSSVMSEWKRSV